MRSFDQAGGAVEVDCYSGYRGDERPVRFRAGGAVFEVEEILDQWRTPDAGCFKVRTARGDYILLHHTISDTWTLEPCPARTRKDRA